MLGAPDFDRLLWGSRVPLLDLFRRQMVSSCIITEASSCVVFEARRMVIFLEATSSP